MVDVIDRIIGAESGGRRFAKNPRSSAFGPGQFTNATWLSTIKKHRPDIARGRSDAELLALRSDPQLSREMTSAYARENQAYLKSRGVPVNPGTTYLAHFAGPGGAVALYSRPSEAARAILGNAVIEANPFLKDMTGRDVVNWASSKMQGNGTMARQPMTPTESLVGENVAADMTALTPPNRRYPKLADAMMSAAIGAKPQGWGDLVKALASMYAGSQYDRVHGQQEKDYRNRLTQALMAANDGDALTRTLLSSGDPDLIKAGITLKGKALAPDKDEFGTTAQYFTDAQGNLRIGQLSKSGKFKAVELPEGATVLPGTDRVDLGTEWGILDKRTGQIVSRMPKDVSGEATQKEIGKAKGEAVANLPKTLDAARFGIETVDKIMNHPALSSETGMMSYVPRRPGSQGIEFRALLDQLRGQVFLQAFNALRGGGHITEVEGQKAEAALARLNTDMSREDFMRALQDIREVFQRGAENAMRSAGQEPPSQAQPQTAPKPPSEMTDDELRRELGIQ